MSVYIAQNIHPEDKQMYLEINRVYAFIENQQMNKNMNSTIKPNWSAEKNMKLLNRYQELNLIPFSCSVNEILKHDGLTRKELTNLPSHSNITKFDINLIRTYNGLCLKMGTKLDDDNYVILVDVDNKNGTVDKWLDLLKQHQKTTKIKTPTAITGNDGIHYLFKVPSELYKHLQNAYTGLNVDGVKLDIDIKCNNGLQLAEPTKYKPLNGPTKA